MENDQDAEEFNQRLVDEEDNDTVGDSLLDPIQNYPGRFVTNFVNAQLPLFQGAMTAFKALYPDSDFEIKIEDEAYAGPNFGYALLEGNKALTILNGSDDDWALYSTLLEVEFTKSKHQL